MITDFINYILDDILDNLSADRVVIACIHSNSFKDYEYYSKVFSISYEVCNTNISSIKDIVKDIPISVLEKELGYYENDILIVNPNSITDQKCLDHLNKINASSIINVLIKHGEIITGILSVQYCKSTNIECPSNLTNDARGKLLTQVKIISSFI